MNQQGLSTYKVSEAALCYSCRTANAWLETLDNVDYYRLNLDNVERIEIVKGRHLRSTVPMPWGVINIIKKSSKAWSANANVGFGAYGEQRYGVSAGINSGHINNMANVQHTDVDEIKLKHSGDYSKIFANRTWDFKDRLIYTYNDKLNLTARADISWGM